MAYDIGYDTAKIGPARSAWEPWSRFTAPIAGLAHDLIAALKPLARTTAPSPIMVEDLMLRPTLVYPGADLASARTGISPASPDWARPLALLKGALLVWRRDDTLSDGRGVTLRIGLVLGGRSADTAVLLLAFSFSR